VQPVSELAPTPVQVMTEPDGDEALRSSNCPAPTCSAPEPSVVTAMVTPVPPVVGTDAAPAAKVSGSVPTDSMAGSPATGSVAEGFTAWTRRPTPMLSPAGRFTV
jgi:hypothetical protein